MKLVKQKDSEEFFVNEDGEERRTSTVIVEEPLLDYWVTRATEDGRPALVVEEIEKGAFFDPGGMIAEGEPQISIEVRGQKLGCWLRSADELAELLRRDCEWADDPDGPPHCYVRGRWYNVLLTPETAKEAADAIEKEYRSREHEADDAEHKITMAKIQAGVVTQ